jgi:tRNA nucleotidyltransferase (CCA-adding enzyme)
LRGVEPHDFDITTSALPEETKAVFSGERIIETGIKHGTVSLIKNDEQYEITTYRIDGEYEDSRHPKSVSFTERIEEDLARRDFTVNAIAYSEKRGMTDPFGGQADIEKKLLRAVGNAEKRFDEDALRIIRGIRFAGTLGYTIEEETKAAMLKKAPLLENISKERIFVEWKKLLDGALAIEILKEYKPITDLFFPEAALPESLNREAFFEASPLARHISLFAKAGESAYRLAMRRLKTDNLTVKSGASVISALGKYGSDNVSLAFLLRDLGADCARLLIECEAILGIRESVDLAPLKAVEQSGIPYKLSDLAVNGNDLLSLGYKGAEIKATLASLQTRVLSGELQNKREYLIDYLKKL